MDAHAATLALLASRAPNATLCPSEVARKLATAADTQSGEVDWRSLMPAVHAAVDLLAATGQVHLSWKGRSLAARAGPYRIGRVAGTEPR